jgi:hypothetical protein
MPFRGWRLAVFLPLLVPDVVVLSLSAPLEEYRPATPEVERELEARKADRRERFNRKEPRPAAEMPKPVPFDPNPPEIKIKGRVYGGGALVRAAAAGAASAGGAPPVPSVPGTETAPPAGPVEPAGSGVAAQAAPPPVAEDLGEAWLEGRVRQPDGSPVAWLEVRLRADRDGSTVATTVTDGDGDYRFTDVGRGAYRLEFGPSDAALGSLGEAVEVRGGEYRRDWSTPRLGGLKVLVTGADGARPAPGREVRIRERLGEERLGVTDGEGVAHFRNLPVGSYRVVLMEDGVRAAEARQAVVARATSTVEIRA